MQSDTMFENVWVILDVGKNKSIQTLSVESIEWELRLSLWVIIWRWKVYKFVGSPIRGGGIRFECFVKKCPL